jgi:hypothetical protein
MPPCRLPTAAAGIVRIDVEPRYAEYPEAAGAAKGLSRLLQNLAGSLPAMKLSPYFFIIIDVEATCIDRAIRKQPRRPAI